MKSHHWYAAAFVVALLVATGASAQDYHRFDDHDRQAAHDWYVEHQRHAPRGLRDRDRLSIELEGRLLPGRALDRELRRRVYSAPYELRRHLPPPPRNHKYVIIGGHVVLVESRTYVVRDVIHLH